MKKVFVSLLAVVMVLSLFAGCSNDATEKTTPLPSTKPITTPAPSETSESGNEGFVLPIAEEKMSFEMFAMVMMPENMVDLNDGFAFQELEKRTNIHFEWQIPTMANGMEQFNLLLASTDYPDAIQVYGMAPWIGGLDTNVDDGFILDATDMLEKYAPNYTAKRTATPELARDTTTDLGRVVAFRPIYETRQPTFTGPVVRQDLLTKAGYTGNLITVDDWYNALTALKSVTEKQPLYLVNRTNYGIDQDLATAFNVATTQFGFIQVKGKIQFSFISEGMKEYLSTMSKWYDEGLIDRDFASRTNQMRGDYQDILSNNHAMFESVFTYIDTYESQAKESGYELTPIKMPIRNAGDVRHIYTMGSKIGAGCTTLFPDAHDPEVLIQLFDYLYTDEGALLYNYGVEGQGFSYVDGKPKLSELVVKNPDGIGMSQALSLYCFPAPFPGAYDWGREFTDLMSEKAVNANYLWSEDSDLAYELSDSVTMTSDDTKAYSATFNDINTYILEQVPRFIIGDLTVAEDWDGFVSQVKSMGIDECIGYWQSALDRYSAR